MSRVKIQIFHENGAASPRERTLIKPQWLERDSHKKLTAKQAGRILANNFPDFDNSTNRDGLIRVDEGFYTSRTFEPLAKCDYQYIWEIAIVSEDAEEQL